MIVVLVSLKAVFRQFLPEVDNRDDVELFRRERLNDPITAFVDFA
jgi:hypothetical protein